MKTSKNLITIYYNKIDILTRVVIENNGAKITMNVEELQCEYIWEVFKYLNKAYKDYMNVDLEYVYKEESRSK